MQPIDRGTSRETGLTPDPATHFQALGAGSKDHTACGVPIDWVPTGQGRPPRHHYVELVTGRPITVRVWRPGAEATCPPCHDVGQAAA